MRLTSSDGKWYTFFHDQFGRHWELIEEDVPQEYDWRAHL